MSRRRLRQQAPRFESAAAATAQPLVDSVEGLVAAARRKTGPDVTFVSQLPEDVAIPAAIEDAGYRICEAALDNAMRYAAASWIMVEINYRIDRLIVRVSDDGDGFDPVRRRLLTDGQGSLDVMDRCARGAGGSLDVRSAPGAGTCVSARFELRGREA